MALQFNGTEVENVYFNGTKVERVFFNNTLVYESTIYIDKPTVTGSYIFANAVYEPEIVGYDENQLTVGGITSARNAGTYTVTFTPKKGFAWKDGTTLTVSYTWDIAKRSIVIPALSETSFSWVEGTSHAVTVNNLDSTYVNQSGTASQTDSSSNIGTNNTVTWSLKFASDTVWSDDTTANKSASWSTKWVNGTSHYKNDIYNSGWHDGTVIGVSISESAGRSPGTLDLGGSSQPYICHKRAKYGDALEYIYVKDTKYLTNLRWVFKWSDNTAREVTAAIVTLSSSTKYATSYNYKESTGKNTTAKVTAASGTVYGVTPIQSDSSSIPALTTTNFVLAAFYITRIYHT